MQGTVAMIITYTATVCGHWGLYLLGDSCKRHKIASPYLQHCWCDTMSGDFGHKAVGDKAKLEVLTHRINLLS